MLKQTFGSIAAATLGFITLAGTIGSIAIYGANLKNDFESAKARVIQLETQVSTLREQLDASARNSLAPAVGPQGPAGPTGPQGPAGPKGADGAGIDMARIERIEAELTRLGGREAGGRPTASRATSSAPADPDIKFTDDGMTGVARDGTGASWPFSVRSVVFTSGTAFTAEIEWPSLESVNSIAGEVDAGTIRFVERAFIKRGKAALGCEYDLKQEASGQFAGTFRNCHGSPGAIGQVSATLRR